MSALSQEDLSNISGDPVRSIMRILAAFGVVLLLGCGWLGDQALVRVARNEAEARHSRAIQSNLETLLSAMKDAETGQRGYVITGRERYLEPYEWGLAKIEPTLSALSTLVADDAAQRTRLAEIRQAIDVKVSILRETIDVRRIGGDVAARDFVLTDQGKSAMDHLRILVAQAEQAEEHNLVRREAESARSGRIPDVSLLAYQAAADFLSGREASGSWCSSWLLFLYCGAGRRRRG